VGINYSSFRRFGKNVFINFGEFIQQENIRFNDPDGLRHQSFNTRLQEQLEQLVFEIPKDNKQQQKECLEIRPSLIKQIFLALPAAAGWLLHLPLYLPVKRFTWKRTHTNDHYDSVLTGILLFTYPLYVLMIIAVLWIFTGCWWTVFLLLVFPFTAWAYVQLKPQLDR
jgi:hypothetical protein